MSISPEQVEAALQTFASWRKRYPEMVAPQGLPETCRQLDDSPLRIAVVGEIKKGKSSLLNALIGVENLSPVSSDIATSVVFRLHYSAAERNTVEFNPTEGAPARRALSISRGDVPRYGTEDANPGNSDGVDCISLGVASPFLAKGFELLDTPGLGGLFSSHAEVTWKHIPRAHFVLFVLDSAEAVMSRHEADYLGRLNKLGKPVFFVQTKADAADTEQVSSWKARNLAIISKVLGKPPEQVPYFCVSATMWHTGLQRGSARHIERSGFEPLIAFLDARVHAYRHAQRRKVVADIDSALVPVFTGLKASAEAASATAGGAQQRQALDAKSNQLKKEFGDWQAGPYREAMREIQQVFGDVQRNRGRELRNVLSPAVGGALYDGFQLGVEALGTNPQQAEAQGRALLDGLADHSASSAYDSISGFQSDIGSLLKNVARKVDLESTLSPPIELGDLPDGLRGRAEFSYVARGKTASDYFADVSAFSGALGVLTVVGLGAATFGGAYVIAGIAAVAISASRAETRKHGETQQLKARLIQAAQNLLRMTSASATAAFEDLAVQYKRAADEMLEGSIVQRRREVSENERAFVEAYQQQRSPEAVKAAETAYREMAVFRTQLVKMRDETTGG